MKPVVLVVALVIFITFFCDNVYSEGLSEDHWKFICHASRKTVEKLLDCFLKKLPKKMDEAYKRLEICLKMPLIDIVEAYCTQGTPLPEKEKEGLKSCLAEDSGGQELDEDLDPNLMVYCLEDSVEFQKMKDQ